MYPLDQSLTPSHPRHSLIAILAIAGCLVCLALGVTAEFSADLGLADPPQYVAAQDPFRAEEVNPTYSSTYDDNRVVYGTHTYAPSEASSRPPAHTNLRDRVHENRAERRGWRAETPFMQRGPTRRLIAGFGTGLWRLLRPRGRFVHCVPTHPVRVHGFSLAMANA